MTRTSIREYNEAIRDRYRGAPRKEKSKILDEFTKVTGYHHEAVIRLLHWYSQPGATKCMGILINTMPVLLGHPNKLFKNYYAAS
jgi:hypothetical protein